MFDLWGAWKKGFDAWEDATARYLEQWLKSPMLLSSSATMLSAMMKLRAGSKHAQASFWSELGLPTKHDQERSLHLLHQLNGRLMDLEARLEAAEKR